MIGYIQRFLLVVVGGNTVIEDQTLVAKVLGGDQQSFAMLVERHQQQVYNLTYRMLNNAGEAEDAAQEAFLRAYQHLDRYDPTRPFKTWLLSIASNHCIDRIRKRRMTLLSIDEPLPPHPELMSKITGPEESLLMDERNTLIQEMLEELPSDYRAAVILKYWYDMSYAEIAETLETTESAIKSRLFRARQTLAQKLEVGTTGSFTVVMESA